MMAKVKEHEYQKETTDKYKDAQTIRAGKEGSPRWGRSQEDNPSRGHLDSEARRQTVSWKTILIIFSWDFPN